MACVVVHPLQSLPGHPRYALDPAQAFGTRTPRSDYLHGDTIFYVSRIIMNDFRIRIGSKLKRSVAISQTLCYTFDGVLSASWCLGTDTYQLLVQYTQGI